jgi:long-chain acyl-CoA synthetase
MISDKETCSIPLPFVSVIELICQQAKMQRTKTALQCDDTSLEWEELGASIERLASGFSYLGIRRGDRIATLMPNKIHHVVAMLAALRCGAVIVPLSGMLSPSALASLLQDASPKFSLIGKDQALLYEATRREAPAVSQYPYSVINDLSDLLALPTHNKSKNGAISPDDDFSIIYSSGTTGIPKGIVHSQLARLNFALGLAIEFRINNQSHALISTPLCSNASLMMLLPTLVVGGTVSLMPAFDAGTLLKVIEDRKCTHTMMVPLMFATVFEHADYRPNRLSSMVLMVSAGSPLKQELKQRIVSDCTDKLSELYGLTEGFSTTLKPDMVVERIDSVGNATFGNDIRIIDDAGTELGYGNNGEIVGRGPSMMSRYFNKPQLTMDAQWTNPDGLIFIRSGDIGHLDSDGYLTIVDRKKDMILSGGLNVYPSDIEAVLSTHPQIADVAVIGMQDEKWGEVPYALAITKPNSNIEADQLAQWANARLGKAQRLKHCKIVEAFPRNALGKVLKSELRKLYGGL